MAKHMFLVRLGEISLKGQNRSFFENKLKANIKYKLKPYKNRVSKQKGRIFVEVEESCPESHIHHALSTTFGIVAYSQAIKCDKNLEAILESAISIMDKSKRPSTIKTFKVETVRSDKSFYLKSYDISREVGHSILTAHRELTVDVHNPDCVVKVEIRDAAYIHPYEVAGQGGLPVGTAGEATHDIYQAKLTGPLAIVMGAEGDGMRRLTRETCDHLIKIPMAGSVSSLNVSVASGICLFEAVRQRLAAK